MKKLLSLVSILLIMFLYACGGGGGGSSSEGNTNQDISDTDNSNRALLGPLSGATVEVYKLSDLANPIFTTTTTTGSYDDTGFFDVTLPDNISEDEFLLISISGGYDIDTDDDGVEDSSPVQNQGKIRAIVRAGDINQGIYVNAVTEMVYLALQKNIQEGFYENATLLKEDLRLINTLMFKESVGQDNDITYRDMYNFNPLNQNHKNKLSFSYNSMLPDETKSTFISMIHNGENMDNLAEVMRIRYGINPDDFTHNKLIQITPTINIPTNREGVTSTDAKVSSFISDKTEVYSNANTIVMAEDSNNRTLLLGYYIPEKTQQKATLSRNFSGSSKLRAMTSASNLELSIESTALSLVMIRISGGLTDEQKTVLANNILAHPEFNTLVSDMTKIYQSDPYMLDHIFDYTDIVNKIRTISDEVFNNYINNIGINSIGSSSSKMVRGEKINDFWWGSDWDDSEPWTWYTEDTQTAIKLKPWAHPFIAYSDKGVLATGNPTLLYYLIETYRDTGNKIQKDGIWYIVPRSTSFVQKTWHSGAQYWNYGEDIGDVESIRHIQMEKNGNYLVIFLNAVNGISYVVDILADGKMLSQPVKCIARPSKNLPQLLDALNQVFKDSITGINPLEVFTTFNVGTKQDVGEIFTDNFTSLIELSAVTFAKGAFMGCVGAAVKSFFEKQLPKIAAKATSKWSNPAGWAWMIFDAANGLAPWAASWAADSSVGYDLYWDSNGKLQTAERNDKIPTGDGSTSILKPKATFTYTHESGLTYTFDASGSIVDENSYLTYEWEIDGVSYSGQTVSHTFRSAGEKKVTLYVTDTNGFSDEVTQTIDVKNGFPPVIDKNSIKCTAVYLNDKNQWRVNIGGYVTDPDSEIVTYKYYKNTDESSLVNSFSEKAHYFYVGIYYDDDDYDIFTPMIKVVDSEGNSDLVVCSAEGNISMDMPNNLTGTPKDGAVDLTWNKVEGAEGYYIYVYNSNDELIEMKIVSDGSTTTTVSGLTNGETYSFTVAAYNEDGTGKVSDKITVTPGAGGSDSDLVFSEDFSADPGYATHISSNIAGKCTLQWDNGSYYAQVSDVSDSWYCVAEGPTFQKITASDGFRIEFDFNPVTPDWGNYPGIYFVDSSDEFPDSTFKNRFSFHISWSDNTYKKFQLFGIIDDHFDRFTSPTIPASNEWYHVVIVKDKSTGTLDLKITREDGSIFVDEHDLAIPTGDFDQILIGEKQGPTKYGDFAEIRVDNVKITKNPSD